MKATLDGHQVAASDDIVEVGGYHYFPPSAVHMEWLEKAPKTDHDKACPHGVQFYDVVVDGVRHVRNAWIYEIAAAEDGAGQGPRRLLGGRRASADATASAADSGPADRSSP